MLTRDQIFSMLMIRSREGSVFSGLPNELIRYISNFARCNPCEEITNIPSSDIDIALALAADGTQDALDKLVKMIEANPRLLVQAGNVTTRGGVKVIRTALYEFFLGEGDPVGAAAIQFGFARLPDGEVERAHQCRQYKQSIKNIAAKKPAYDLTPLFNILMEEDSSKLRDELEAFRKAVEPTTKRVGMHYDHYATLQQALDLLDDRWNELTDGNVRFDRCGLIWKQVIGYLQLKGLPAVDRFAFARAFKDAERSVLLIENRGIPYSFPDAVSNDDHSETPGLLGVDYGIFGTRSVLLRAERGQFRAAWRTHLSDKHTQLTELVQSCEPAQSRGCVIC